MLNQRVFRVPIGAGTTLWCQAWLENPLQIEFLMGTSSINGGFQFAMFDYRTTFSSKDGFEGPNISLQHLANPLPSRCRRPCRRTELFSTTVLYPLEVTKTKVPRLMIFLHGQLGCPLNQQKLERQQKGNTLFLGSGLIKAY